MRRLPKLQLRKILLDHLGFSEDQLEICLDQLIQEHQHDSTDQSFVRALATNLGPLEQPQASAIYHAICNAQRPPSKLRKVEDTKGGETPVEDQAALALAEVVQPGRQNASKDDLLHLQKLREEARKGYLKERELTQLELAERVASEREQWYSMAPDLVTETQVQRHRSEKSRIELARKVQEERRVANIVDAYEMPSEVDDARERSLMLMRGDMREPQGDSRGRNEPDNWERQRLAAASLNTGSSRTPRSMALLTEVGDEVVEFVLDAAEASAKPPSQDWMTDRLSGGLVPLGRDSLKKERELLPIYLFRDLLLKAVRENPILIIVGETGSGKTTQIPQYLYEVGYCAQAKIGCTQPRRVAAMSVSSRVCMEMGKKLGREVGFIIRFENCITDLTKIIYMTDGMLLQQLLGDPLLVDYSVIMIDEAHERTLHTDILLGLVKDLSRERKASLRLLISSATLEATKFSTYFDGAPIFKIPGRKFPVDVYYTKNPEGNYITAAALTVFQIHTTQDMDSGDILVFLPGQLEIELCHQEIVDLLKVRGCLGGGKKSNELIILSIYSALPTEMQVKVFQKTPKGCRKCVLATNIAETSITIDNIVYVIDSGLVKQNIYNPKSGLESLTVVNCSRASANQRAGRAGRVRHGKCFRLYTQLSFAKEMEESNVPEIQRSNIIQVILSLKNLGIENLLNFDFMDKPSVESITESLNSLYLLGALNNIGNLTEVGRKMSLIPGNPFLSKMIIESFELGCLYDCLIVSCMLEVSSILLYRSRTDDGRGLDGRKLSSDLGVTRSSDRNARLESRGGVGYVVFFRRNSDHLSFLSIFREWEASNYSAQWCFDNCIQFRSLKKARDILDQLISLTEKIELPLPRPLELSNHDEHILQSITAGFFLQSAYLTKSGTYKTFKSAQPVDIHPSSALCHKRSDEEKQRTDRPTFTVYNELVLTNKEYMRNVSETRKEWLLRAAPKFFAMKGKHLSAANSVEGKRLAVSQIKPGPSPRQEKSRKPQYQCFLLQNGR